MTQKELSFEVLKQINWLLESHYRFKVLSNNKLVIAKLHSEEQNLKLENLRR